MTIDPISVDYAPPAESPNVQQTAQGEQTEFSEVLARTSQSNGSVDLDSIFEEAGLRYNLSPDFLKAVARVESSFRPDATSPSGAMGVMQLMPATATYLGVTDPYDPYQNIMGGARLLREFVDQYGDVQLALAAYNSGPGNVSRYGGIPPFTETQNYVRNVMSYFGSGNITAGVVTYNGIGGGLGDVSVKDSSGSFPFSAAFTQMLMIKIIEMQMNSSNDDDKKVF